MIKLKIFVVGPSKGYARPFFNSEIVNTMGEANMVLFTGGEDINPEIYNCKKHSSTWFNSSRDKFELDAFEESLNYPNIKIRVGTCRGAQLFCALSGGLLVQDVTHHIGTHYMINKERKKYPITSIHHQMQFPFNLPKDDYEILYWASPSRSSHYLGDKIQWSNEFVEPEIVHYKKHNLLGIQGHPEMMSDESGTLTMINEIIQSLIKN